MRVLAAAADETIRDAVRAGHEHCGEVMVDLMGVPDLVRRAAEVDRLGVRWVCLHTPVDVLRSAGTAVAGGITPATAPAVAALRPDIVVVGSAITRAADPRAAATALRRALGEERR